MYRWRAKWFLVQFRRHHSPLTLNQESNFTCRQKEHFLFHWNTLISQGQFTQIWTLHKEKRIDDYWNVDGNRSLSDSWTGFTKSTLLKETPPNGYMWPGWDWQKFKRRHVQIIYGLKLGQELEKPLKEKKNNNGHSKSENSRMPEVWGEFVLLIQVMKITRTSLKMQGGNWKHTWLLQCHVKRRLLSPAIKKPLQ